MDFLLTRKAYCSHYGCVWCLVHSYVIWLYSRFIKTPQCILTCRVNNVINYICKILQEIICKWLCSCTLRHNSVNEWAWQVHGIVIANQCLRISVIIIFEFPSQMKITWLLEVLSRPLISVKCQTTVTVRAVCSFHFLLLCVCHKPNYTILP